MSVGPTALSSLLVQRLDAVLGTQLAQQGAVATATRADAVAPPGGVQPTRGDTQGHGNELLEQLGTRDRQALREAAEQAELAAALRSRLVSTNTTPSAPTTLGQTARVILTLLAQYPDTAPALAGKVPLWSGRAADTNTAAGPQQSASQPGDASGTSASTRPAGTTDQAGRTDPATAASAQRPGNAATRVGLNGAVAAPATGAPQAAQLATALKQAIETSGLFYEAHLSDMAHGRRPGAHLRAEPQAGLDAAQAPPIKNPVPAQSILADNPRLNLPTHAAPMTVQADGQPAGNTAPTWSASTPAQPPAPPPGIHPDAALLVRQQLEVLANQTLAWEGTAWPGTDMWWEIRRESRDEAPAAMPTQSAWATRLVLTMPRLGTVEARLSLSGERLGLQLVAPESEAEIASASAALRQRMEAAGLELAQLTFSAHAPAAPATP